MEIDQSQGFPREGVSRALTPPRKCSACIWRCTRCQTWYGENPQVDEDDTMPITRQFETWIKFPAGSPAPGGWETRQDEWYVLEGQNWSRPTVNEQPVSQSPDAQSSCAPFNKIHKLSWTWRGKPPARWEKRRRDAETEFKPERAKQDIGRLAYQTAHVAGKIAELERVLGASTELRQDVQKVAELAKSLSDYVDERGWQQEAAPPWASQQVAGHGLVLPTPTGMDPRQIDQQTHFLPGEDEEAFEARWGPVRIRRTGPYS